MDEVTLVHTLDIEAYEAAKKAALDTLRASDLRTFARVFELAQEDGVVGDAARDLLDES